MKVEKENRDYEKEINDLLKLIDEEIPKEVKKSIEIVISAQKIPQPPQIKISNKGAFDAD